MKKSLILLLLAVITLPAAAQDPGAAEQNSEPRRYAVEMIIFEYAEDFAVGSEVFIPEIIEEEETGLVFEDVPAREEAPVEPPAEIRQLEEDELSMRETYNRLRRLEAYRPLMYFGWEQETLPDRESPRLPLALFGAAPDALDGSVSLELRRYLHLGVDLTLTSDEEYQPPAPGFLEDSAPDDVVQFDDRRREVRYAPVKYRLREDRIMKSGDVRYYDHPKFGVVAKVRRIESDGRVAAGER
jgi:hypothetical protein